MANAKLGILLQTLRGKVGNAVFAKGRTGTIVRSVPIMTNPNTPAQASVRTHFTTCARAFHNLTTSQFAAWEKYAESEMDENPRTGVDYVPSAQSVFMELQCKFLQVNPSGTLPTAPPTSHYSGDSITVTASAGAGTITFTASGATSLTTKVEMLIQPLKNPNGSPQEGAYRSQGFVSFATGTLTHDVSVTAGYYATAYRFVNTQTGQQTLLVETGTVTVGAAMARTPKKAA